MWCLIGLFVLLFVGMGYASYMWGDNVDDDTGRSS